MIVAFYFRKQVFNKFMKRFPSIKKNREFREVYQKGTSYANRLLVMYVLPSGGAETRIGISVSKKIGNSVIRHRITRLVREIFRLHAAGLKQGLNIIVVARQAAKESDYRHLESAFKHLCGLHHIAVHSGPSGQEDGSLPERPKA